VVRPLVECSQGYWVPDSSKAPMLVPLLSLGQCMVATAGGDVRAGTFSLCAADVAAGQG